MCWNVKTWYLVQLKFCGQSRRCHNIYELEADKMPHSQVYFTLLCCKRRICPLNGWILDLLKVMWNSRKRSKCYRCNVHLNSGSNLVPCVRRLFGDKERCQNNKQRPDKTLVIHIYNPNQDFNDFYKSTLFSSNQHLIKIFMQFHMCDALGKTIWKRPIQHTNLRKLNNTLVTYGYFIP